MSTTALVKGHTLRFEGQAFDANGYKASKQSLGYGKCSCGALSDELDSNAARKRWHRAHKAEVIAAQRPVSALPEPPAPPEDCCANAEWRGRLCAYHQGFEDGWEALREALEK